MNDKQTHPLEQLPFLVNGTLAPDERGPVEVHLEQCASCRAELEFLRALQKGVRETEAQAQPGELAWQRLRRALEQESTGTDAAATGGVAGAPAWMKYALAASLVLVLAQGLVLWRHSDAPVYRPAGTQYQGAVIQLRFRDQATEAQIRALLQSVGGRIIDGPGAVGIYRVALDLDATDAAALRARIEQLRARTDLVEYAGAD